MKLTAYETQILNMSALELYTHCIALVQSPILCQYERDLYLDRFSEAKGDLRMTQIHWSRLMYIITGHA